MFCKTSQRATAFLLLVLFSSSIHQCNALVNVTREMYLLSSEQQDICLQADTPQDPVRKVLCNGDDNQLWIAKDFERLVFSNVLFPDKYTDIGNTADINALPYWQLVFGQGYVRLTEEQPECPVTCGWGVSAINYECINANGVPPAGWVNAYCDPEDYRELQKEFVCQLNECPPEPGLWSEWSGCTATCGGGIRQRLCDNPPPTGDESCSGNDTEECNVNECPIDGGYGALTPCSVTCGNGVRVRKCNNPTPQFGGRDCERYGPNVIVCDNDPCPDIDGGYTEFGDCSVTCGTGVRTRQCTNPQTSGNGTNCIDQGLGPAVETCKNPVCPPVTTVTNTVSQTLTITDLEGTLVPTNEFTTSSAGDGVQTSTFVFPGLTSTDQQTGSFSFVFPTNTISFVTTGTDDFVSEFDPFGTGTTVQTTTDDFVIEFDPFGTATTVLTTTDVFISAFDPFGTGTTTASVVNPFQTTSVSSTTTSVFNPFATAATTVSQIPTFTFPMATSAFDPFGDDFDPFASDADFGFGRGKGIDGLGTPFQGRVNSDGSFELATPTDTTGGSTQPSGTAEGEAGSSSSDSVGLPTWVWAVVTVCAVLMAGIVVGVFLVKRYHDIQAEKDKYAATVKTDTSSLPMGVTKLAPIPERQTSQTTRLELDDVEGASGYGADVSSIPMNQMQSEHGGFRV
ncbi:hypothetical protein SARC_11485 [Sphaeroforma arctica JP610]|uniref:Ricin B lectin domain-containing protein n=1 Tax=Sphaeroforma arctica JP610 TaxID=667725 RepID=A0A0L0FIZ6_9EUKA|nr:hypothetical protein SARC_11485 [Sphaeroforma arctica JP610]KNC76003.1 hypothetical protein SARC_11485 [Sphaeroforma arctica JP610]|eukprot:XP_014149905.1 hypothetical protein SARC_11485 [Sphaeroforma arctica JP610]